MLVSFKWLKEFVDTELSASEVADLLTMSGGIEVESVSHIGQGLEKVLTARIEEITPHPNSGKLTLPRLGFEDRFVTVVCGASNIKVGQIVPYAPPGAILPSGLEIREKEVSGVLSPGMLCSEKELELGEDASGIMILESSTPVGAPLTRALPFVEDHILETSVTPNRGDCLSVMGIAREIAALTDKPWKTPQFRLEEAALDIRDMACIEVPDADLCPRYVARLVEGVVIGPSPLEVRLRLARSGVRPISNVVDATNLILLECGQPLHAFDFSLLEEGRIVVRRCDPGETFVTLDGTMRVLPQNALMIRDGKRSVALAGIMGGLNSEIQPSTRSVLIESACFERLGIGRTAKALGMATEASYRFERGVDPQVTLWAAHRAAYLISQLAGGTVLSGHIDIYPRPIERPPVRVRVLRINRLLGLDLGDEQISSYLTRLGIEVENEHSGPGVLKCRPPSWRWDLEREPDFSEEVARVHGFRNIPISMPSSRSAADHTREGLARIRKVNGLMNSSGFTEIISMSFISRRSAGDFVTEPLESGPLELLNPLTEDCSVMRTSLIPGLVAAIRRNLNFRSENLKLYELGKTFTPVSGQELPREDLRLAAVAVGSRYPELWHFHRGETDVYGKVDALHEVDFYDIKGALENVLEGLGIPDATFVPSRVVFLHPGKSAEMLVNGERVGFLGELLPAKARELDLPARVQMFEILLEPLFVQMRKERVFRPLPRYPYIERDLSLIVETNCSGDKIKHLISRLGHDIIASVILFDMYRGESIPEGRQSMAFRIRYQSEDRTLTDEEVQEVHSHVVDALVKELGASMRE